MAASAENKECPSNNIADAFSGKECVIFGEKLYVDKNDFVAVKGTLTADWIGYKNNTWSVMCFHELCTVASVEQIGPRQIGSIDGPNIYSVDKWTSTEIVAHYDDLCYRLTFTIDRKAKTLLYVETPINQSTAFCSSRLDPAVRAATIENPSYFKSNK
jgi:hypothetical protein